MQASDLERLKGDLDGILAVVEKCPTDLQQTAFRVILERWLADLSPPSSGPQPNVPGSTPPVNTMASLAPPFIAFTKAHALTEEALGKVFHPVGPGAQLMVSEVPGAQKARKQINLALLIGVAQAMTDGVFRCGLEELREKCVHYGCYDASNFATNLKNAAQNFKTVKKGEDVELSGHGMKQAADLVKSLAGTAG